MNNHNDANVTGGKPQNDKIESKVSAREGMSQDKMGNKVKFVRSINSGNIFLIGHTDTKTTIIVTLNGILLGLLADTLHRWPAELQSLSYLWLYY